MNTPHNPLTRQDKDFKQERRLCFLLTGVFEFAEALGGPAIEA